MEKRRLKLEQELKRKNKLNKEQYIFDLGHITSHSIDDYIVSDANILAFEHIISFPNWRTPMTLLLGPPKSGKSHLARIWQEISKAYIVNNDMLKEITKQGGVYPVLIDNIDKDNFSENNLFHFLNQSIRDQRPLLMSATKPIASWPYKTADLLSRARLATSFFVAAPDDVQLSQMFAKLFDDRQIAVEPKIISYLISRMERSSEEAVLLVDLMDRIALTKSKPITKAVALEALDIREMEKKIGV